MSKPDLDLAGQRQQLSDLSDLRMTFRRLRSNLSDRNPLVADLSTHDSREPRAILLTRLDRRIDEEVELLSDHARFPDLFEPTQHACQRGVDMFREYLRRNVQPKDVQVVGFSAVHPEMDDDIWTTTGTGGSCIKVTLRFPRGRQLYPTLDYPSHWIQRKPIS